MYIAHLQLKQINLLKSDPTDFGEMRVCTVYIWEGFATGGYGGYNESTYIF